MGAVIDRRAFDRNAAVLDARQVDPGRPSSRAATCDDSVGYFVEPTVLVGDDPIDEIVPTEIFGPILSVHVYDDAPAPSRTCSASSTRARRTR